MIQNPRYILGIYLDKTVTQKTHAVSKVCCTHMGEEEGGEN